MESLGKEKDVKCLELPPDFEDVLGRLVGDGSRGGKIGFVDGVKTESILPISTEIIKQEAVNSQTPKVGQLVKGKGIYIGIWEPTDGSDNSLGRVFNLYAAPEDLKKDNGSGENLLMTFNDAVRRVAGLKNWHGHNGGNFENAQAVLEAVRNNPEKLGDWFVPIREILHGQNVNGEKVQVDNFYDSKEKMPSDSKFVTTGDDITSW